MSRNKRLGIGLFASSVVLVLVLASINRAASLDAASLAPSQPQSTPILTNFDPAYYGLPDVIAGYRVLMVQAPENIACMRLGTMRLILQASQPDLNSFLTNTPGSSLESEVAKFNLASVLRWEFQFVGPGITKEDALAVARDWDPKTHIICLKSGPIVLTPTPYQ